MKTVDHVPGEIPYVSSSAINNGVDDFIGNSEGVRKFGDCMTIANSGSVGKTFFHEYEFIASDHVTALKSLHLNKYTYMFIATIAQGLREKYSFNREINEARINHEKITLPVDDSGQPDWPFMEEYMRERERLLLERYSREAEDESERVTLDGVTWGEFAIGDLFDFGRGKVIDGDSVDQVNGMTAYVTRTERNNGVNGFIDYEDASYLNTKAPVITIGNETAAPFVHTYPFYTGTNINILQPRAHASRNALIFIAECFRTQKSKYSYGYAASSTRLKRQRIQLPIDEHGQPDYIFMEKFMRSHERRLVRLYVSHLQVKLRTTPPQNC